MTGVLNLERFFSSKFLSTYLSFFLMKDKNCQIIYFIFELPEKGRLSQNMTAPLQPYNSNMPSNYDET